MRIQFCDGYYQDGDLFFYHSNETGLDTLVSEDEAIAHKPGMYLGEEDRYYNNFNFDVEKVDGPETEEDLWSVFNTYVEAITMLEEVCDYLEKYGNFDGVGAVYETIIWMKEQKRDILKKIGIIY